MVYQKLELPIERLLRAHDNSNIKYDFRHLNQVFSLINPFQASNIWSKNVETNKSTRKLYNSRNPTQINILPRLILLIYLDSVKWALHFFTEFSSRLLCNPLPPESGISPVWSVWYRFWKMFGQPQSFKSLLQINFKNQNG